MPGLVPGIHVSGDGYKEDVDGRDKPGHDEKSNHFRIDPERTLTNRPVLGRNGRGIGADDFGQRVATGA
jgi:hypothetical protein